ncbi:hypothetical protein BDW60DRAFT_202486 [Aspergillus nidulans var. acristatus]
MDRRLSIATPSRPSISPSSSSFSLLPTFPPPHSIPTTTLFHMTLINNLIELLYISASMGVDSWSDLLAIELIHLSALSKNDLLSELVELFLLLTMQKLLGFLESRATASCFEGDACPNAEQREPESDPAEPADANTKAEFDPGPKAEATQADPEAVVKGTSTSVAGSGFDSASVSVLLPEPKHTPKSDPEHRSDSGSDFESVSSSASELVTESKIQGQDERGSQTNPKTESQTEDPLVVNEEQDGKYQIESEYAPMLARGLRVESQDQHEEYISSEDQINSQQGLLVETQDQDRQNLVKFEPASNTQLKSDGHYGHQIHSGDQKGSPLLVDYEDQVHEEHISAGSELAPISGSESDSESRFDSDSVSSPAPTPELVEEEKTSVTEHQGPHSGAATGPSILQAKPGALILRQNSDLLGLRFTVPRTRSPSPLRSSSRSAIERLGIPMPSEMPRPSSSNMPDSLADIPPEYLQLPFVDEHVNSSVPKGNKNWHSVDLAHEQLAAANLTRAQDLSNCDLREPVVSDCFEKRWINDKSGFGLVATKHIPAGTVIIADELMTLWSDEHKKCKSYEDTNAMLQAKAANMGPEWNNEFLSLAKGQKKKGFAIRKRRLGLEGAIWDQHALPTAWEGNVGEVLGLNLAWLNHCCIPNCVLRFRNEYPTNKKGEVCYDKKPRLGRAVVRACADIKPNVEINIAYMQTEGTAKERRAAMNRRFGFLCACRLCATPHPSADKAMCHYRSLKRRIEDPNIISNKPAIAYLHASMLLDHLVAMRVQDSRVADIWVKCAMIAGHHTDLARAWCFLREARELYLVLEGLNGASYHQVEGWYRDPTSMPGFGGTRRGLSSRMKAFTDFNQGIMPKKMLFMLDAKPNEYIAVPRYHPLPRTDNDKGPSYEIIDGPDFAPAELKFDSKNPSDMCRTHDNCQALVEHLDRVREKRRHRGRAQEMADDHDSEPYCPGFKQDFLAAFIAVARERFGKAAVDAELEKDHDNSEESSNREVQIITSCGEACLRPACAHQQNPSCACDEEPREGKPDNKENEEAQIQDPTVGTRNPLVKHVGAEKKPQVVNLDDFAYCDAGVEYN